MKRRIRVKQKEVRAAEERGLISEEVRQFVAPRRHRRTCPTCGGQFLPPTPAHKGSCCSCCALAWILAVEKDPTLRNIKRGDRVVILTSGLSATIVGVHDAQHAIVELDDGRRFIARPDQVDRVLGLEVQHYQYCRKLLGPPKKRGRRHHGDESEDRGEENSLPEEEEVPEDEVDQDVS